MGPGAGIAAVEGMFIEKKVHKNCMIDRLDKPVFFRGFLAEILFKFCSRFMDTLGTSASVLSLMK